MCVKLPPRDLNPYSCIPYPTNTYTCRITTIPRMYGGKRRYIDKYTLTCICMVFIKNKVKNMYKYQEKYIQLEWICLFKSINYWKIQFFLNEYYKWNIYYFLTCLGRIKKKKRKHLMVDYEQMHLSHWKIAKVGGT